jgi:hypothetical protein
MCPCKGGFFIGTGCLVVLMLSPMPSALAAAQTVQTVEAAAVAKGVRVSKLIGSTVRLDRDERIGSIDDIIIDEKGDLYAVLEVGGFLGLGGRRVALPFKELKVDPASGVIAVPGATKEQLEQAPAFEYRK